VFARVQKPSEKVRVSSAPHAQLIRTQCEFVQSPLVSLNRRGKRKWRHTKSRSLMVHNKAPIAIIDNPLFRFCLASDCLAKDGRNIANAPLRSNRSKALFVLRGSSAVKSRRLRIDRSPLDISRTSLAGRCGLGHHPPEALIRALVAIVLIQGGYWTLHPIVTPLPRFTNALLENLILFVARMGFVFAGSVFGFVFIVQKPEFQIPASRHVLALVALFSLYCYVQELERLGRALIGTRERGSAGREEEPSAAS